MLISQFLFSLDPVSPIKQTPPVADLSSAEQKSPLFHPFANPFVKRCNYGDMCFNKHCPFLHPRNLVNREQVEQNLVNLNSLTQALNPSTKSEPLISRISKIDVSKLEDAAKNNPFFGFTVRSSNDPKGKNHHESVFSIS